MRLKRVEPIGGASGANLPRMNPAQAGAGWQAAASGADSLFKHATHTVDHLGELRRKREEIEEDNVPVRLIGDATVTLAKRELEIKKTPVEGSEEPAYVDYVERVRQSLDEVEAGLRERNLSDRARAKLDPLWAHFRATHLKRAEVEAFEMFVDYERGSLKNSIQNFQQAAIASGDLAKAEQHLGMMTRFITHKAGQRIVNEQERNDWDAVARAHVYTALASQEATSTPLSFAMDGWEKYKATSMDQAALVELRKKAQSEYITLSDRSHRLFKEKREEDARTFTNRALRSFTSTNPQDAMSKADVEAGLKQFENVLGPEITKGLVAHINTPGGATNQGLYHDLRVKVLLGDAQVQAHTIIGRIGSGLSAEDAEKLVLFQQEQQQKDDVSHSPFYKEGQKQIAILLAKGGVDLGGLGLGMFAGLMKPEEAARYSEALVVFAEQARALKKQGKPLDGLPRLAQKIAQSALGTQAPAPASSPPTGAPSPSQGASQGTQQKPKPQAGDRSLPTPPKKKQP